MERLKEILFALTHPLYWIRNYPTSKTLDKWFKECIDKKIYFKNISQHVAILNGVSIWIYNHPYASFEKNGVMPKRRTVYLLKEWLIASEVYNNENN